jgi:predicted nucleic acid-binding protein
VIVVDTNVVAGLYIPGPDIGPIRGLYDANPEWAAPKLWRNEMRNVLSRYCRAGEMSVEQAIAIATEAESVLAGQEYEIQSGAVLKLASASGCTACDCEFVALALALGVPLVTLDRKVLRAFPEIATSPETYLVS